MSGKSEKTKVFALIDARLNDLNLTRRYLSDRLGVSEQSLCAWWKRGKLPDNRAIQIARELSIDPGDLAPDLAAVFREGWIRDKPITRSQKEYITDIEER